VVSRQRRPGLWWASPTYRPARKRDKSLHPGIDRVGALFWGENLLDGFGLSVLCVLRCWICWTDSEKKQVLDLAAIQTNNTVNGEESGFIFRGPGTPGGTNFHLMRGEKHAAPNSPAQPLTLQRDADVELF
jgi:hypothetical protein